MNFKNFEQVLKKKCVQNFLACMKNYAFLKKKPKSTLPDTLSILGLIYNVIQYLNV